MIWQSLDVFRPAADNSAAFAHATGFPPQQLSSLPGITSTTAAASATARAIIGITKALRVPSFHPPGQRDRGSATCWT
jgi:hypothetical protein